MSLDPHKRVVQKLCDTSERLIQGGRPIRGAPCVASVESSSHLRRLLSGARVDFAVEVTLQNSAVVTWSVEVAWEPTWIVEAGISLNRTSYQESIADLGEWTTSDVAEFEALLDQAVDPVLASQGEFDFCRY